MKNQGDEGQDITIRPPRPGIIDPPSITIRPPRPGIVADLPGIVRASDRVRAEPGPDGVPLYALAMDGREVHLVLTSGQADGSLELRAHVGELPRGLTSMRATGAGLDAIEAGDVPTLWWNGAAVVLAAEWRGDSPADG